MIQAVLVIAVVAVAILVGQAYPFIGGLIATLPIKIGAYAIATQPGALDEAVRGMVAGAVASAGFAIVMLLTLRYGFWLSLVLGFLSWVTIAALARQILQ